MWLTARILPDDIATATAISKQSAQDSDVMVDLGIPPGFDLLAEDLQDYHENCGPEEWAAEKSI
jgi:hypothetical protein